MQNRTEILLVDNKIENIIALEKMFPETNGNFVRATSGSEALKKTLENDFALAIINVQMPDMDGYETVELMREEKKTAYLPVLFISAVYKDIASKLKALDAGRSDFIKQPVERDELLFRVSSLLNNKRLYDDLSTAKEALAQKNTALKEMIEQINIEKNRLKEDIAVNVKNTLLPILSKIRFADDSAKYKELLQHHLKEMISSFGHKMSKVSLKLTPKEIEICNMVKGGLSSKEICNLLFISDLTVERHRRNIRKKLGLSNKKVNLATFLYSL